MNIKIEIKLYETSRGHVPFNDWFYQLDRMIAIMIRARLDKVKKGTLGAHKLLIQSGGVWELKFQLASGLRIYFGKTSKNSILLLLGGNKNKQSRDIQKAIEYWNEYKIRIKYEQKEIESSVN